VRDPLVRELFAAIDRAVDRRMAGLASRGSRGRRPRVTAAACARSSYLGFPLEITDRTVAVFDKRGRRLVTVASIGAAHRFIRGYRRVPSTIEAAPLHPAGENETAPTQGA
jgi:hypothetical protein